MGLDLGLQQGGAEVKGEVVGRQAELMLLNQALQEVKTGAVRIVTVEGAPGIGKTTLLNEFHTHLTECGAFVATGEQSEVALEFGVLGQLLNQFNTDLPNVLRPLVAVRPAGLDPLMVGASLVEALGDIQVSGPVVLILDDVQWADLGSLQALAFAFRRLSSDRALLILSFREAFDRLPHGMRRLVEGERGRRLTVRGLPLPDVAELAKRAGRPLSAYMARRLQEHTDGNPLYLKALMAELEAGVLEASWDHPLPAPHFYRDVVVTKVARCSAAGRALVEAAAVFGVSCRLDDVRDVVRLRRPLTALDESVSAGLLTYHETPLRIEVRFAHPLIRAAVYQSLPLKLRSALHARAGVAVGEESLKLRHEALARQEPDAELASRLEDFAHRQMTSGSWIAAATALVDAARLSPSLDQRDQRRLDAVDCHLWVGDAAAATHLLAEGPAKSTGTARHEYMRARLCEFAGSQAEAELRYQRAWRQVEPGDQELATRIAGWYGLSLMIAGRTAESIAWTRRALRHAPSHLFPVGASLLGLLTSLAIRGETTEVERLTAELPNTTADIRPEQLELLLGRGISRIWGDRVQEAKGDLALAVHLARQRGAMLLHSLALGHLADAEYRLGDWDASVMHAEVSASTAEDGGNLVYAGCSHAVAALPHIARGAWEQAESHVRAAEHAAHVSGVLASVYYSATSRARLELFKQRPAVALQALKPLLEDLREPVRHPGIQPWQLVYVEGLSNQGNLESAARELGRVEQRILELGLQSQLVVVARLRGELDARVGRPDRSFASFERGLADVPPTMTPFEFARLELAYGSSLRRHGHRRAARRLLESAREKLLALRAQPVLRRCDAELAGAGMKPIRRTVDTRNMLTSQELAVGRLVAEGLSTRDVAAQMVVSARTVEYHLANIYDKLGFHSRSQLVRYMLERMAGTRPA